MEIEPTPEFERIIGVECDQCGEDIWLLDETCEVQVYLDEDVSHLSFAILKCDNKVDGKKCDPVAKFITIEQVLQIEYLGTIEYTPRPSDEMIARLQPQYDAWQESYAAEAQAEQDYIDAESTVAQHWGEVMLKFLGVYDPEPWEFSSRHKKL